MCFLHEMFPNRGEIRRLFYFWRWPFRLACHTSIVPCQYIDNPNDNHGRTAHDTL